MAVFKNGIFATYNGQIITPQSLGISVAGIQTCQQFFTSGSLTDTTQRYAVYALVGDLENYGIWDKMKAIYPMVGGTSGSHKFNLKDPRDLDVAYRLTFTGGWTHSSTGALPNGTTGTANTYYTTSTPSEGLSFYNRTNSNRLSVDIGFDSYFHLVLGLGSTSARARNMTGGNIDYNYGSTNVGFWQTNRITTGSNGWNFNYNGNVTGQNSNYTAGNYGPILMAQNPGTGLTSDKECAFASIHIGLTSTEAANFYTAVQRFQTTLGRQV
jgi:hypothetical protein